MAKVSSQLSLPHVRIRSAWCNGLRVALDSWPGLQDGSNDHVRKHAKQTGVVTSELLDVVGPDR
eukprot:749883-Hanusia_phi.AAC.3